MHVTDEMVKVAVTKSVEAGLLPRRALKEDFDDAQTMMRMILQSTLNSSSAANAMQKEQSFASQNASGSRKKKFIAVDLHNYY